MNSQGASILAPTNIINIYPAYQHAMFDDDRPLAKKGCIWLSGATVESNVTLDSNTPSKMT
jgi:hypothetical protein